MNLAHGAEALFCYFCAKLQDAVPELGIAVADRLQGKGLGKAVMSLLVACARAMDKVLGRSEE